MKAQGIRIERWLDTADKETAIREVDAIFFESSGTKSFPDDDLRQAFRERWLGRYFEFDPKWAYLARAADRVVAGYLVGCLDDPARTPRFSDLPVLQEFKALTLRYPAHLHVNCATSWRSKGVGAALVERFCGDAAAAGSPGVHIVTGQGMRNVRFYERLGFAYQGRALYNGTTVVLLGRELV